MAPPFSLRQIRCFIAVAEELNFRRAAERLCITQPPLSRQIQQLEAALGTPLFVRDRRHVELTEAGAAFLPDARALVRDSEQAALRLRPVAAARHAGADAAAAALPAPVLRLGLTTVVDVGLFSGLEAALRQRWPGLRLTVRRQASLRSIRELHQGLLDLAVIGLPSRTEGLCVEPLHDDPLVACLPSGHRCARRTRVALADLADEPMFWFARRLNPAYHDHCERVFSRLGHAPPRLPEPAEHPVLLGLVAAGQGIALLPRSLRSVTRRGVVFKPLVEGAELGIRLALAGPAAPGPWALDAGAAGLPALLAGLMADRQAATVRPDGRSPTPAAHPARPAPPPGPAPARHGS